MPRKIPATMATQHPDNACSPYWLSDASGPFSEFSAKLSSHGTHVPFKFIGGRFVTTFKEPEEAYRCYSDLGCEEYMWDWEGKHADESVVEKLYERYLDFFKKKPLGKEITLSFRIPNVWKETNYRLAHAFESILSANDFAHDNQMHQPPIVETYLPMTTSADQLIYVRQKYEHIANAFQELKASGPKSIDVIPLVEEVELMMTADKLVDDYIEKCKANSMQASVLSKEDMRVWFARSDPAMNCGMIPAILAIKAGLSGLSKLTKKTGITFHPMIGVGCLGFRGGLSPDSVQYFVREYPGMRTVTLQSAFRYDYPQAKVQKAVSKLNTALNTQAIEIEQSEEKKIAALIEIFSKEYKNTVEALTDNINDISAFVPERRERKLHTGVFGYARSIGKKKLPRAVKFSAAFYSLGVPPEFIGAGRGILEARKAGLLETLERNYTNLRLDLETAGRFLNKENLKALSQRNPAYAKIALDVELIEDYLGTELGPHTSEDFMHRNVTSNILLLFLDGLDITEDVVRAGEIRKSLG